MSNESVVVCKDANQFRRVLETLTGYPWALKVLSKQAGFKNLCIRVMGKEWRGYSEKEFYVNEGGVNFVSAGEFLQEKVEVEKCCDTLPPDKTMMIENLYEYIQKHQEDFNHGDITIPDIFIPYNINNKQMSLVKALKAKLSSIDRKLVKAGYLENNGERTYKYNEELKSAVWDRLLDAEDTAEFRKELATALKCSDLEDEE